MCINNILIFLRWRYMISKITKITRITKITKITIAFPGCCVSQCSNESLSKTMLHAKTIMLDICKLVRLRGSHTRPIHPYQRSYQKKCWIAGSSDKSCLLPAKKSKISRQSVSIEDYIIFECQNIFTFCKHFAPAAKHLIEIVFVSEANFDCAAMREGDRMWGSNISTKTRN